MKPIVLVGGGINHYRLIRTLKEESFSEHPIILVSQKRKVFDNSKIPSVVAGHLTQEEAYLDLWKACQRTGVYFIDDKCLRLNREEKIIELESYGKIQYERLSIECESEPIMPLVKGSYQETILSIHDQNIFLKKVQEFIKEVKRHCPRDVKIAISGGHTQGLELALAIRSQIESSCEHVEVTLFTAGSDFFTELRGVNRKAIKRSLKTSGVRFLEGKRVEYVDAHEIYFSDHSQTEFDIFIPYENFKPTNILSKILQSQSQKILVNSDLSYYRDHNIFVHGDCVALSQDKDNRSLTNFNEQVEVLSKNLLREDIDDPLVDYRFITRKVGKFPISENKFLKFVGPFSWESHGKQGEWSENLKREMKELKNVNLFPSIVEELKENILFESNHMSRPWRGAFSHFSESEQKIKLLSFNGFNWWGSYIDSAKVITKLALLKAISQGVKPEHLRFNLTLPQKDSFLIQHIFESTFKAIEQIAEINEINIDGGDTFNGEHWHLSITVAGERVNSFNKQFLKDEFVLLTRPLGFGVLWASRLQDSFNSQWIESVVKDTVLPSFEEFQNFIGKWNPGTVSFVEEWGFLYQGLQRVPVDQQLIVNFREIPRYSGVDEVLKKEVFLPSLDTNWQRIESEVAFSREEVSKGNSVLWDPLSQGSLMISLSEKDWKAAMEDLKKIGFKNTALVGCVRPKQSQTKIVLSDWRV